MALKAGAQPKIRVRIHDGDGDEVVATGIQVRGNFLLCHVPGMTGQTVVMDFMAVDPQEFWDAWRAMGGEAQDLRWDDGSKYVCPYPAIVPMKRSWLQRLLDWLFPTEDA